MLTDILQRECIRLLRFVEEAKPRPDWHEPNEQGIYAEVVGTHLDNAMGSHVSTDALANGFQEFVVCLRLKDQEDGVVLGETFFNLANLLAIAAEHARLVMGQKPPPHSDPEGYNEDPLRPSSD